MNFLKGIRVLDLTRHLPGPFATSLLAHLGADVIKVELPQMPDPARRHPPQGAFHQMLNRGKRSVLLDFSKPQGRDAILRVLEDARVLVEGFRPGLMDRLKLGYADLRRPFPFLIYCSITGYGQTGPWARLSGHDLDYQALSGILSQSAAMPPLPFADLAGGFYVAFSIAAALRSKRGCHLDVSMTEAACSLLHFPLSEFLSTGREVAPGARWWNGGNPFYGMYQTKGGSRIAVAALEKGYAYRLLDLIGGEHLEVLAERPEKNAERLRLELGRIFESRTRSEWERILFDKEACLAPVLSIREALKTPQALARRLARGFGKRAHIAFPVLVSGSRPDLPSAPALGAHTTAILREAGFTLAQIRILRKNKILG